MWPVLVIPYNMPPKVCTKESNYMMALLIPGPKSPGKDFDLFMEPLVEELQQLWKVFSLETYIAAHQLISFCVLL